VRQPVVLTAYPLSGAFRDELEAALGAGLRYVALPWLRRLPPAALARTLTSFRGAPCYVALEDPESRPLLPILAAVAALSAARRVELVERDLSRSPLPRLGALRGLSALLGASVGGRVALRACRSELEQLVTQPPRRVPFGGGKRILFVNGNLWFGVKAGGSIGHVAGVVNGFLDCGYEVDVATAVEPVLIDAAARVERLRPPSTYGLPVEVNYYRFQRSMVTQLAGVPERRPDFVYQRLSIANYAGVRAAASLGVPLVLEYNGSEVWAARHWGSGLRYEREALLAEEASLRHAQVVVTVSEVLADELEQRGVERRRIAFHPNGVDPRRFDPAAFPAAETARLRRELGIPEDALVAAFVGTFGQWHGTEVLARAIRDLAEHDADWLERHRLRFLLVGDGLRQADVRRELGAAGLAVTALPGLVPQHEAPRYLAAADILLSPHVPNADGSRFFGSPTKLFEYMAMARPIIASALDQIGDVLRPALDASSLPEIEAPDAAEQRVAVLAPPGDADAIAAAVRFLVERPAWRARLGANARARALAEFTWRSHVDAILGRIEDVRRTDG
jgi:glycosyltransferase involved in cell wall biosynthesis